MPDIFLLTMGEPAGIAAEITLKAWQWRKSAGIAPFALLGNAEFLAETAQRLKLDVPVERIGEPAAAAAMFARALPVIDIELEAQPVPGTPAPATAPSVIAAIERGVELIQANAAQGLITNPIHKETLEAAGFPHPGHTEFLWSLAKSRAARPVMLMASPALKTVPVTVHIPLDKVASVLTMDAIVEAGEITARALKRYFGCAAPRLAVCGLNPHAGEGGTFGTQDDEIIQPAIDTLRARGIAASGPHAADSLFHESARAKYDAVLAMYHDQALIPIKTIAFDQAVNVTLGLDFIRTSPDHGTALDIVGQGVARPDSLIAALTLAAQMSRAATQGV